jgi:hypothetical protein
MIALIAAVSGLFSAGRLSTNKVASSAPDAPPPCSTLSRSPSSLGSSGSTLTARISTYGSSPSVCVVRVIVSVYVEASTSTSRACSSGVSTGRAGSSGSSIGLSVML